MTLNINGVDLELSRDQEDKRLVRFLREDLNLTGVKNACDIGACGACTLLVDDQPMRICTKLVKEVVGSRVLTIEGLQGPDGGLHPLQQAFIDAGSIQCGFCTPGMVLTAHAFLLHHPNPTRQEIRRSINANLCRCTGYHQIINAIESAAVYYQGQQQSTIDTSRSPIHNPNPRP